jgi:hypothetical protein
VCGRQASAGKVRGRDRQYRLDLVFFRRRSDPRLYRIQGWSGATDQGAGRSLAPDIRVNAVAPGWIDTELTKGAQADKARSDAIVARTPFGRWGKPGDVGGAVVFLCSQAASFITGTVLPVDGGYMVK